MKKKLLNSKIFILIISVILFSCKSKNNSGNILEEKKKILESLKQDIKTLEAEIKLLDTTTINTNANKNNKLLSIKTIKPTLFEHYIELQGKVVNESNIVIMPLGMPGQLKQILKKDGQKVKKDEIILKLDDTIIQSQINSLEAQLEFAKDLYQRQNKLWQQKIGSEVQLLTSKNNVTTLENQIQTLKRNLELTNIKSPIDGVIDILNIRVGEMFTGIAGKGDAQLRVMNLNESKVITLVPENYISKLKLNASVKLFFADNNQNYYQKIKNISNYIDPSTRSFTIDISLPYNANLKPNQIASVNILDYSMSNAIVVPVNIIQTDETGKYVYTVKNINSKNITEKVYVKLGEVYGEDAQILNGLKNGDIIVTEGYQNIFEGQELTNIK